ncbi:MAG: NAD-dependent malic enzyme, partial [Candidatus Neomarinimicrobiota bacterium]|nr:NAD-dependent malic enzyme [Candidatus Neomarinimicrobiota bacterium]
MVDYKRRINELPKGSQILHEPLLNKGTAFTARERVELDLVGLLPPTTLTIEEQKTKIMENFHAKQDELEKYIFMIALQDRNETLFYRTVIDEIETMMPIIYTPIVGKACQQYGHIFRRPRGLFISVNDRGNINRLLRNWPNPHVDVIVVTDGERILGLGDLGAQGMGIPVGKLSLYTACAGIDPARCLPIMLDVGTDNEELRKDPLYIGITQKRLRGSEYDGFVDEFMNEVQSVFPDALIQFEDFANINAERLLNKYCNAFRVFNDDIQGTAAVTLAGLMASQRITHRRLQDEKLMFYGAGTAGIGIAELFVAALQKDGLSEDEARSKCWFIDSQGLVVKGREKLTRSKLPFAHHHVPIKNILEIINTIKPTALIGVSGQPQSFTKPVLQAMARINERPIIFALSNPTSMSECTADQAYGWTNGRCVFASGSPFQPVTINGESFIPGQGNNAYIFPGVGLGVVISRSHTVPDTL